MRPTRHLRPLLAVIALLAGCLGSPSESSSPATPSTTPNAIPSVAPSLPTWTLTGSLAAPRDLFTATLLDDGTVLVAGGSTFGDGSTNPETLASAELYDPASGTWTATGAMAAARYQHSATLLPDGTVLVAGGSQWSEADGTTLPVNSAELYDPRSRTWIAAGGMLSARWAGHTATLLDDGQVLVTGGFVGSIGRGLASAELYNPATGAWGATGSMTAERFGHSAALLPNGTVLVAGGSGHASAELYDPAAGTWTSTGTLGAVRQWHTATRLADGTVMVAGGQPEEAMASAERYDPTSRTWTAAGTMINSRHGHTATLLPDGTVLVAGGSSAVGAFVAIAAAELYDPLSGSWVTTASMSAARAWHTATLLSDGTTLVLGGGDLAAAELYDPGSAN